MMFSYVCDATVSIFVPALECHIYVQPSRWETAEVWLWFKPLDSAEILLLLQVQEHLDLGALDGSTGKQTTLTVTQLDSFTSL